MAYFEDGDRKLVTALFEAILPGRPDAPGATDAAAVSYVDNLLASGYSDVPRWREAYRRILKAAHEGEPADVLAALAPADLALLRDHCIEGCFADPRWGGNRDGVMWRWFGYVTPAQPFHRKEVP